MIRNHYRVSRIHFNVFYTAVFEVKNKTGSIPRYLHFVYTNL